MVADLETVRILDAQTVIATHSRSFDRGRQIEDAAHIATLIEHKHAANAHRGADQLINLIPASRELLTQATERGEPLARTARVLTELLGAYGVAELTAAIAEAVARGVPHPNAVRLALERRRQTRDEPPPVAVVLPDHVKRRDVPVRPHALDGYDRLMEK